MRRPVRLVALLVALVVVPTGCLRAELGVTVDGDRSGEVVLVLYIDEDALRSSGVDASYLEQGVEAASGAMDGVDVDLVKAPGEQGIRMRVPFDDYRQLTSALTNANALNQPLRAFRSFDVTEGPDDRWTMRAEIDPSGFSDVMGEVPGALSGAGVDPAGLDPGAFDPGAFDLELSVTLPGVVVRSNSTDVDGGTASWKLTGDDAVRTMTMATEPGPCDWQRWAVVGAAIVGAVLVVLLVRRRRRRRRGSSLHGPSGGPGPEGAGPFVPSDPWAPPGAAVAGSAGPWGPPSRAAAPWGAGPPSAPPLSEGPTVPVGGWAAPGSAVPSSPGPVTTPPPFDPSVPGRAAAPDGSSSRDEPQPYVPEVEPATAEAVPPAEAAPPAPPPYVPPPEPQAPGSDR